jgi:hypothetical protein
VAVMVAPDRGAPLSSEIVPWISEVVSCEKTLNDKQMDNRKNKIFLILEVLIKEMQKKT